MPTNNAYLPKDPSRIPAFFFSDRGAESLFNLLVSIRTLLLSRDTRSLRDEEAAVASSSRVGAPPESFVINHLHEQHQQNHHIQVQNEQQLAQIQLWIAMSTEFSSCLCEIIDVFVENAALQNVCLEVLFLVNSQELQNHTNTCILNLIHQLQIFCEDLKTQQVGLLWMCWIAHREPPHVLEALTALGGIDIVLAAMGRFSSDAIIVNSSFQFLERLISLGASQNPESVDAFGGGRLDVLFQLLMNLSSR